MATGPIPDSYEGGAFHPQFGTRRAAGTLQVGSAAVRFQGETGSFELPLDDLEVNLGGASDRLVFFASADAQVSKEYIYPRFSPLEQEIDRYRLWYKDYAGASAPDET